MVRKLGALWLIAKTLSVPPGVIFRIVSTAFVTNRLSDESIAKPKGWKLPVLAKMEPVPSGVNLTIVSLVKFVTNKLPCESNPRELGSDSMVLAKTVPVPPGVNFRIAGAASLPLATKRLPDESKANANGAPTPVAKTEPTPLGVSFKILLSPTFPAKTLLDESIARPSGAISPEPGPAKTLPTPAGVNFPIVLLLLLAVYRLPDESNAKLHGLLFGPVLIVQLQTN